MKKQSSDIGFFGGFEAVVDNLAKPGGVHSKSASGIPGDGADTVLDISKMRVGNDYDDDELVEQPITLDVETDEEDENTNLKDEGIENGLQRKKEVEESDEEIEEVDEDEEIEGSSQTRKPEEGTLKGQTEETPADLSEYETDIVEFLSDKLSKELGWEITDDIKPKTVADVVALMDSIIEENSKPDFANDDIEKLNTFVKEGGDFRGYMSEIYGGTDYENIDLSSEKMQKKVITENMLRLGYSDAKIQKSLARYEDTDTLEAEAEEALESMRDYNQTRAEALLAEQQNAHRELTKQQQKFYSDVQSTVGQLDSIRGIPVSAKEKKELLDYIFKPEADGRTKYQKDYIKNYKNLIESAYFTMRGDSLLNKVVNKATSQAARNLQEKLASKGKRTKSSGTVVGNQNTLSAWDAVSSQLRRPKY